MSNSSKTNFDSLRHKSDDEIDYSDIPPLDEAFFNCAELRIPAAQAENLVRLDPDIVAWFKARGGKYQDLINSVLREHITAH